MEDFDFNLEEFLEKPSTPIEPTDNFNLLYIVSHVPYPMHYSTLMAKDIKNERIKAVINADNWNEFRRNFNETCRDIKDKVMAEKFKWLEELSGYLNKCREQELIIQNQKERIAELEATINAIGNILNPDVQIDTENETPENNEITDIKDD